MKHGNKNFKLAPSLYNLKDLPGMTAIPDNIPNMAEVEKGVWMPARPLGYYSWRSRLRLAWMVFTGRADVLVWPGGQ